MTPADRPPVNSADPEVSRMMRARRIQAQVDALEERKRLMDLEKINK